MVWQDTASSVMNVPFLNRPQLKRDDTIIDMVLISSGAAAIDQLFDYRHIGELKSRAAAEFETLKVRKGTRDITYEESLTILSHCWESISSSNVLNSWNAIFSHLQEHHQDE